MESHLPDQNRVAFALPVVHRGAPDFAVQHFTLLVAEDVEHSIETASSESSRLLSS